MQTPEEIYRAALRERHSQDPLKRREACEKGWLAVTVAVDGFLAQHGKFVRRGTPEAHGDRREFLSQLAEVDSDAIQLANLVSQVADQLHGGCFYEGRDTPYYNTVLKKTVREILTLTGHPLDGEEAEE